MTQPRTSSGIPCARLGSASAARRLRRLVVTVVCASALLLSGCSFFAVRPPPPREYWVESDDIDWSEPVCTHYATVPTIDAISGASLVVAAVLAANVSHFEDWQRVTYTSVLGVGGLAYGIGAAVGFHRVARCQDYLDIVWGPAR